MPRPPSPAVLARLARADDVMPSIRFRCARALRAQAREAAERVAKGLHPIPSGPARGHLADEWAAALFDAKRPGALAGTRDGYALAERADLPAKTYSARLLVYRGKAKPVRLPPPDVDIGGESDFIRRMNPQPVDKWLEESSNLETQTSIRRYGDLYDKLVNYRDPDTGFGLNPKQVAKKLLAEGLAWSRTRAELMARTTSIWALNEGAHQFYVDAGFSREEWMTTDDEALCFFCAAMDGKTIAATQPFWEAGDIMADKEGNTIQFPFDIQHPPLHVNCRCALLPVP